MAKRKSNSTSKIYKIIGGLVGLLLVVAVVVKTTGILGPNENKLPVEVISVEARTITQMVTASGKVQPEIEVKISPDVSGEIIELNVEEGDWVEKGTLLLRIRPDFYQAQVEQQQAGVSSARASQAQAYAQLLKAGLDLKRQKELFGKGLIPESEFQSAETSYQVAEASHQAAGFQVASSAARLREANENLAKTTIYSPMSGTISRLNIEAGERVVGTTQMAGTELLRVARLDQMELEVDVNENDVVNVSIYDTTNIEIDAYPNQIFKGIVTEIANSARVSGAGTQEQVTNFPVKIKILDNHNMQAAGGGFSGLTNTVEGQAETEAPRFRPGMSGTVDILTNTVTNTFAVPIQSVTVRDFNKKGTSLMMADAMSNDDENEGSALPVDEDLRKIVFVMEADTVRMIEVATGISDQTYIQISSGLSGGENVIVGPYSAVSRELIEGAAVEDKNATKSEGESS